MREADSNVTLALPMFVREGTCQPERCGSACCQSIWIEVNPFYRTDPDISNWVRLHGIDLVERGDRTLARIPVACTALDQHGGCSLYGQPERPYLCDAYPAAPASLDGVRDVCTYTFRDV